MTRTRSEVRAWLESQVGTIVTDKSNSDLNGQCVALIKALMEFLGIANPYAARGNAKDVISNYTSQGIGKPGRGWLTICANRNMGGGYGHVWADLLNEANFESNGARALVTTKNTRPIGQAQQILNFDQYIKPDPVPRKSNDVIATEVLAGAWGNGEERRGRLQAAGYDYAAIQAIVNARSTPAQPPRLSNDQIADQVIAGAWGNGEERRARLARAGYDYDAVQAAVNSKMPKTVSPTRKSNEQIANEIIAGLWGKGQERKDRLAAAGYDYGTVQTIVNRKLGF